jgi:acyl-CoA synthetase (AMP-forming)/AMP-acid ligase II
VARTLFIPQVLEAAVVGVEDEMLGERVIAVITLRKTPPSSSSSSSDAVSSNASKASSSVAPADLVAIEGDPDKLLEAIRLFLAPKLASYKQPKQIVVKQEIPRNHMGKVDKMIYSSNFVYCLVQSKTLLLIFALVW